MASNFLLLGSGVALVAEVAGQYVHCGRAGSVAAPVGGSSGTPGR
ncbi:hypothetical protein [Micromonospora fluostatini]